APRGEVERALAEVWEQVLRVDRVGRHDNFFELGGDSILTLQIIARARKRGLRFTPRELMERQTVAAVAAVTSQDANPMAGAPPVVAPSDAAAPFAPIPVQTWFFEQAFEDIHHWNQSLLLSATEVVEPARVQQAVEALVAHHEALRLSFELGADGRWSLTSQSSGQPVFEQIDLSSARDVGAAITDAADRAQRSLSLGRPFKAVWMDLGKGGASRLLLTAHHLVVDGVSWRVILEDLQTVYQQLREGRSPDLPPATTPFRDWSAVLARYADSAESRAELPFWQSVVGPAEPPLPGVAEGNNTVADARTVATSLGEARTEQLLGDVPQAYGTRIDEVLLTALARTLCAWDGRESVLVELEGHGREDHRFDGIDLSRTVGWFTSLYPVRLAPGDVQRERGGSPGHRLKSIKEQLRQVPHKGVGYGVLRYLSTEGRMLSDGAYPQVTFNYLGQFDQSFDADSVWQLARESAGQERAPGSRRRTWLSVDADVHCGELRVRWTYSAAAHDEVTVQGLARRFLDELEDLIEYCLSGERGVTPSDFPLARLTQAQIDGLPLSWERLADLYPLSPMQAGMLFHSILEPEGTAYVNQLRLDLEGLDAARFKAAWQMALDRHEVLRTGFVYGETPLQWVARSVDLPLVEYDWRDRADLVAALDALARAERERGFDLAEPPLMRLVLVQCAAGRHHLVWTRHHLLLDGWSTARLMAEILACHAMQIPAPPRGRYRDYIAWLQGADGVAAENYWRALLADVEEPTRLAAVLKPSADGHGHREHIQVFDAAETARLADFARAERVTVNTLVQAGWALLLQRYTGQASVCFGATTSGRPSDLPDAGEVLGLFINTLPVVARPRPEQRVGDWLRELQAQNIASREHEHAPLFEIQRWAGDKGLGLFDSILVFENYPVDEALSQEWGAMRVSLNENREETNYPMTLTVHHGETLTVGYAFQGSVFSARQIERLAGHYMAVLRALAQAPQGTLGAVEVLSEAERQELNRWGVNEQRYVEVEPVHRLIERRARARPAATALV
ncbi:MULTISPECIES: condensation domain-containing protein, partial [Acidovorax]